MNVIFEAGRRDQMQSSLILKRASASRPSGEWSDDDYDGLADGVVVGRIFRAAASPEGSPWMWTLTFGHHKDPTLTRDYEPTREAAMAAFAKSWRQKMTKKRRIYQPRIVGGQVMMPADLKRLHKYMLEVEHIDHISDEMRAVVESEWPELAYTLPPKTPRG